LSIWENRNTLSIKNLQYYLQAAIKNRVINHIEITLVQKIPAAHTSNNQSSETEATIQHNELYLAF
jgi:hypothetical protein